MTAVEVEWGARVERERAAVCSEQPCSGMSWRNDRLCPSHVVETRAEPTEDRIPNKPIGPGALDHLLTPIFGPLYGPPLPVPPLTRLVYEMRIAR